MQRRPQKASGRKRVSSRVRAHLGIVCDGSSVASGSSVQILQCLLIVFSAVVNGEDSVNLVVSEELYNLQHKFLLLFIFFGGHS